MSPFSKRSRHLNPSDFFLNSKLKDASFSIIGENFGKISLSKIGNGFFIELSNHFKQYAESTIDSKKLIIMQIFNYGIENNLIPGNFNNYLKEFWKKKITPTIITEKREYIFFPSVRKKETSDVPFFWNTKK